MRTIFDELSIDIPCPTCGEEIPQKIGKLKFHPELACPTCRTMITVDAEHIRRHTDAAQQTLDQITTSLDRLSMQCHEDL